MEGVIGQMATVPGASILLTIDEQTQIGAARRAGAALGHEHGLDADALGRLAIVVTEAATNILLHAGRGVLVLRGLVAGPSAAVEMLALDKGPGIPDVKRAMRDGHSTAGTAGQGLGGIQRLADVFAVHSQPGMGTALLARIHSRPPPSNRAPRAPSLDDRVGVVCLPLRGETACGDAWRIVVDRQRISVLLVDGLGHGPAAAVAAAAATTTFMQLASGPPETTLLAMDTAMRGTRGAALSLVIIDEAARATQFSGVGNVDARVCGEGTSTHLVPQNGIVGHTMPTVRSTTTVWPTGARLVMHSDGISARWRMTAYPGLATAHPALLAGILYRDFGRARDDVTVLVIRDRDTEERR